MESHCPRSSGERRGRTPISWRGHHCAATVGKQGNPSLLAWFEPLARVVRARAFGPRGASLWPKQSYRKVAWFEPLAQLSQYQELGQCEAGLLERCWKILSDTTYTHASGEKKETQIGVT